MTEDEKPIRVVDRRMFTADGRLRPEYESEQNAEAPETPAAAPPAPPPAAASPESPSPGPAPAPEPPAGADVAGGPVTSQAFVGLVSFLASNVYAALGIDPMTGESLRRREPSVARQMIDWLGALESKARGNLSFEEQDLLARVLYELRLAYVEAMRPPDREPPR